MAFAMIFRGEFRRSRRDSGVPESRKEGKYFSETISSSVVENVVLGFLTLLKNLLSRPITVIIFKNRLGESHSLFSFGISHWLTEKIRMLNGNMN